MRGLSKIDNIKLSDESGFTLLELVVVIGLIALISASLGSLIAVSYTHLTLPTKRIV